MPVIRSSQLKITTIWPELVNKRLNNVTIQLQESQIIQGNDGISVKGLLQRHVGYYDYDGRNRKARDQLQFELMLDHPGAEIDPAYISIEVHHDYFVFQPGYIGENQAIFEHGFTINIHQACEKKFQLLKTGSRIPVLVDLIIDGGQGSELVKGPALSGGPGLKPEIINYRLNFSDNQSPSLVSGMLYGVFSYLNPQNTRLEMEFEQPFGFCLKIPEFNPSLRFQITGDIMDGHWWFDAATFTWQLELKIHYSWRIIREIKVDCLSQPISTPENQLVKLPFYYQEKRLLFPKIFRVSAGELTLHELNISQPQVNIRLTTKGVLLEIDFLLDIYTMDPAGCECYQCHPVNGAEFIGEEWLKDKTDSVIPRLAQSKVTLAGFTVSGGAIMIETMIECRILLYREDWLDLYPVSNPNGSILGRVFTGQKTFSLSGFQTLQLRARPLVVKKLSVSSINCHWQIKPGWIHAGGEFRLAVTYLDRRQCLREDTFPVFFAESFLWENLQASSQVRLACSLAHDSYALHPNNPLRMNYCFWLHLIAESTEIREIPVLIIGNLLINQPNHSSTGKNASQKNEIVPEIPVLSDSESPMSWISNIPAFELEGEIPLKLGKAREIASGRLTIGHFNYRNKADLILVEGHLHGEVEYWDHDGFLRREPADFSFWKCIRRSRHILPENQKPIPGLKEFRFVPVNVPAWQKGRIKIQCRLELTDTP